jgi:hypothetical protein
MLIAWEGGTVFCSQEEMLLLSSLHLVQSYYAQIYLGSPQNTADIRSNNDGYLRNQIMRGVPPAPVLRFLQFSILVLRYHEILITFLF